MPRGSSGSFVGPAQLIGVWRGTSICTDRVAAPACHDETVVYEFTSPRVKSVWRLSVDGARLSGTARLLPGNKTIRKLDLRKE
jgi:hypothetical protein